VSERDILRLLVRSNPGQLLMNLQKVDFQMASKNSQARRANPGEWGVLIVRRNDE
jgi:hypothetical protein